MHQLLHSSPVATPEFAALSLLLSSNCSASNGNNNHIRTTEPLLVVSITSTISQSVALESIEELHRHVQSIVEHTTNTSPNGGSAAVSSSQFAAELLREDERSLRKMQIYRSTASSSRHCNGGLELHYRVMRGPESVQLQTLLTMNSSAANDKSNKGTSAEPSSYSSDPNVLGVILSVGVAGESTCSSCCSSTIYSLEQRMSDSTGFILQSQADVASAQSLLTTFLLSPEDDYRISNERVRAPHALIVPEPAEKEAARNALLSPMAGMISPIADFRLASRRLKQNGETDSGDQASDDNDRECGIALPETPSSEVTRLLTNRLSVLSVAENGTLLRKYRHSGQERRARLDSVAAAAVASKSRFARTRRKVTDDGDLDGHFDYKGPQKVKSAASVKPFAIPTLPAPMTPDSQQQQQQMLQSSSSRSTSSATQQLRSSKKDTRKTGGNRRNLGSHMQNNRRGGSSDRLQHQFDDGEHSVDTRSHSGNGGGSSVLSVAQLQVNIALNEDLTCSYKLSQLSSCNVEGVAQVQVKSSARTTDIPFAFWIRDPSKHIDTLTENRKLAEKVTQSHNGKGENADYMFNLLIPKHEQYFPVLKYKCTGELRPVPIRVQAKVKVDDNGGFCRVALQISSNPNNDASLSDLTIVMGVPHVIRGETLATQPPGGVWDESKSSVIWCVSELGSGEKFQLQARFELGDNPTPAAEELSFPILVRCQCLYVQLSDIEFEVRERPEAYPAEISMKIARRFRLSHRERSG